ncbi:hypothetical protein AMS68_007493 [Peltaster fructicola]|uniref:GPI transamidase component GPI16 n=1 Tax=Peltaster fructicola TaxID=286661 RepID=A0A6H0Y4T2_9PEZI|nr:hypothetical protein AMS68_007493 [Peltaster fructicola]
MRLLQLLLAPTLLAAWTQAQTTTGHTHSEHLELTPLPNHHLHADFTFNATTPLAAYRSHHYRYFPRSLAQILQSTHTSELHLRFALGRWDDEQWGPRPHGGRREGGTGVEIWAWLEGQDDAEIEQRWSALVNSLSGLFCASLNFIDSTKTTSPVLTFEPEGQLQSSSAKLMHGLLPREVICTENLTPFLKLLPCKGKAGISSLLDGHKLFDASWQSMSIDVRTLCPAGAACSLEIEQGISMALSIPRSMRGRQDPIPRPLPREEIQCDGSKSDSHDSCFPKSLEGEMAWSLSKVFGRQLKGVCGQVGAEPDRVTVNVPAERDIQSIGIDAGHSEGVRTYNLDSDGDFDLIASQQQLDITTTRPLPALFVSRQMTGHGQERGGMQTTIRNPHQYPQQIIFFESLPWFIRPYMHTLSVQGAAIEKMYYTPLIDRKRGTHLELMLIIPAESTVTLQYEVEKAILRYTEYPPDANRGFDIGAAVVRVLPTTGMKEQYLRTTGLLLPLPTPDFSMPYNVIILTSTVIALGFGSIFNLLVRKFVLLEEVPESPLRQRVKAVIQRIQTRLGKRKLVADNAVEASDHKVDSTSLKTSSTDAGHANGSTDIRQRSTLK